VLCRGRPLGGNGHHAHQMVPAAQATGLHHIGRVLASSGRGICPALDVGHFRAGRDASPMRREVRAKGISDQDQAVVGADGALHPRLFPKVLGRTHEFGVRIADLVDAEAATAIFIDEVLARQAVVDCAPCTS